MFAMEVLQLVIVSLTAYARMAIAAVLMGSLDPAATPHFVKRRRIAQIMVVVL
jgi:hypothetical protein